MFSRLLLPVSALLVCLVASADAQMEVFFYGPLYHTPPWGPIPQYEGTSYIAAHKMKHAIWVWEDPDASAPRFIDDFDAYGSTYDWGDGTITSTFYDHLYLDDGDFTLSVSAWAQDDGGPAYTGDGTYLFHVLNVDPVIGDPIPQGYFLRPGDPFAVRIAFSDPGILDTHTFEVDSEKPLLSATVNQEDWTIDLLFGPQDWEWGSTAPTYPVNIRLFDDDGGMDERSMVLVGNASVPEPRMGGPLGILLVVALGSLRRP